MPSALAIVGALTIALVGASGMYEWDRAPHIGWHAHVLFWHPGFDLPDSLATQRDHAEARVQAQAVALNQCHANVAALDGAVKAQNAAVEQLAQDGAASLAQSAHAVAGARAVAASYRQQANDLLTAQRGSREACAAADALILDTARKQESPHG